LPVLAFPKQLLQTSLNVTQADSSASYKMQLEVVFVTSVLICGTIFYLYLIQVGEFLLPTSINIFYSFDKDILLKQGLYGLTVNILSQHQLRDW
jgi:hypothetical protein